MFHTTSIFNRKTHARVIRALTMEYVQQTKIGNQNQININTSASALTPDILVTTVRRMIQKQHPRTLMPCANITMVSHCICGKIIAGTIYKYSCYSLCWRQNRKLTRIKDFKVLPGDQPELGKCMMPLLLNYTKQICWRWSRIEENCWTFAYLQKQGQHL